jgi:hypothetical protein
MVSTIYNVIGIEINHRIYLTLISIVCLYLFLLYKFVNIKKFKNGFSFLKIDNNKDVDTIVLAIFFIIISSYIIFFYTDKTTVWGAGWSVVLLIIIIYMIIQKSFQLYYKQKLKDNKLKETEEKLKNKTIEMETLNEEYNDTRKKMHTLSHKQETLEYKINQLENMNIEAAEELDIKNRLKEINIELNNNISNVAFIRTDIKEVDDVLEYMQSRCEKENIKFDVQINGNVYYMVNNVISKDIFATLLSDHIKDAIIAIKHSDNINRSILVRLGIFDDNYSIEILDSGVEFEKEVLKNLGKNPITTYKDEGGTGMGFMNTFDILEKYKASLIINEIGIPCKDNFTKKIIIKFDGKNEFNIISYRK